MTVPSYTSHPPTGPYLLALQQEDGNVSLQVHLFPNTSHTFSFPNGTLLQAECTGSQHRWNRCNILPIADEEDLEQLVLFPTTEGVSILHLDHEFSSVLNYTRMSSSSLPCHPTTLWIEQNEIHVACLRLDNSTQNGECKIYQTNIHLNRTALNESYFEGHVLVFERNYPDLLTNFVTNVSLRSCGDVRFRYFYFGWFYSLYYSRSDQLTAEDDSSDVSEDCAYITELERYDAVHISALCPNRTLESINLCTGQIVHRNIATGLPRTCSHSTETVVYVRSDGFTITNSSSSTPSVVEVDTGNVTHTRCVQGNSTAWLIIESSNLTVTVLRTDDLSILTLTMENSLDGVSVGQVEVWGERYVGFANGTHYLVKDINCLRGNPLFVLLFIPDLSLQLGDPAECTDVESSAPVTTTAESVSTVSFSLSSVPVTPTPASSVSSTLTDVATTQLPTVEISTSPEQSGPSGIAAVAVVPIVVLILIITILVVVW